MDAVNGFVQKMANISGETDEDNNMLSFVNMIDESDDYLARVEGAKGLETEAKAQAELEKAKRELEKVSEQ